MILVACLAVAVAVAPVAGIACPDGVEQACLLQLPPQASGLRAGGASPGAAVDEGENEAWPSDLQLARQGVTHSPSVVEAWYAKVGLSAPDSSDVHVEGEAEWPVARIHQDGWELEGLAQPLVYVVSVPQQNLKRQRFVDAFSGLRLQAGFEWAAAIDGTRIPKELRWANSSVDTTSWDGDKRRSFAGYLAHVAVMREAHERCPSCDLVVFEDDVVFQPNFLRHWSRFIHEVPPDWAILRLGGQSLSEPPLEVSESYIHTSRVTNSWGYVVRATHIQQLADRLATIPEFGFDVAMQKFGEELATYAPQVPLVHAAAGCHDTAAVGGQNLECESLESLEKQALQLLSAWPLGYVRSYCVERGQTDGDLTFGIGQGPCADSASDSCCPYRSPPREQTPHNIVKQVRGTTVDIGNHTGDNPEWFFVHIPKTAGTSFHLDAAQVLQPGVHLRSAEKCALSMKRMIARAGDGWGAMLREPRSHVLSQFLMCKDSKWGKNVVPAEKRGVVNGTFSHWLQYFDRGRNLDNLNCYHPSNLQTRVFSCDDDRDETPHHAAGSQRNPKDVADALGVALRNLGNMSFALLTERYQESLCLFAALANPDLDLPAFCNCADDVAWKSFASAHVTYGTPKHSVKGLTAEENRLLDALVSDDDVLYRAAQKRFELDVRAVERDRKVRILC